MNNFRGIIISAMIVGAVLIIAYGIWKIENPSPFQREVCFEPGQRKIKNDSLFSSTEFQGVITGITDRHFPDRVNVTFVEMAGIPGTPFKGWVRERRFFDLRSATSFRIGVYKLMARQLATGDTIVKEKNSKYFVVRKLNGSTLRSELQFPGYCEGSDCTFRHVDGLLCYTRTEEE